MIEEEIKNNKEVMEEIRKQALKNAKEYGKADSKKIIGKVILVFPNKKNQISQILKIAQEEVERINNLSKEQLEKEISLYVIENEDEKKQKKEIRRIILPQAEEGKVVTRFPPEPGGYLHIGHAKALFLDYYAALEYRGKMLLRFDDTNPQKSEWKYVEEIKKELEWLGIKPASFTFSSDYMEKLYFYAKELIKIKKAYVCICSQSEIKKNRIEKIRCYCFQKSSEQNLEDFEKMINGEFEKGEAVLRFVGDIESENTTMHDPTLFRINKIKHYKQNDKYSCWPTYDFVAPILDSIEGVTHAMRSKEYELRNELYYNILDSLKLRKPLIISFSRLSIKGMPVSKRMITPLINQKKVEGYDDPRLPNLASLRRRGIMPEVIKEFVLSFGLTKVESEPNLDKLLALNKKLIDPITKRRFFVPFPAAQIKWNYETTEIKIKNHPILDLGERKVRIEERSKIYVTKNDVENLNIGDTFRLKDFCSVKITKKEMKDQNIYLEVEKIEEQQKEQKKIQWVSDKEKIFTQVVIPKELYNEEKFNENSLEIVEGISEKECLNANVGEIYQFERFGFVILDKKEGEKLKYIFVCK